MLEGMQKEAEMQRSEHSEEETDRRRNEEGRSCWGDDGGKKKSNNWNNEVWFVIFRNPILYGQSHFEHVE